MELAGCSEKQITVVMNEIQEDTTSRQKASRTASATSWDLFERLVAELKLQLLEGRILYSQFGAE